MIKKYIEKTIKSALFSAMHAYNLEIIRKYPDPIGSIATAFYENGIVPCETCECLLQKENAIKGKSVIKLSKPKGYIKHSCMSGEEIRHPKEYIHTPYYCKTHAPKERKNENK